MNISILRSAVEIKLCGSVAWQGEIKQPLVTLQNFRKDKGCWCRLGAGAWRGRSRFDAASFLCMVLVDVILAEFVLNAVHKGVPTCFNDVGGNSDGAPDLLVVP